MVPVILSMVSEAEDIASVIPYTDLFSECNASEKTGLLRLLLMKIVTIEATIDGA